MQMLGSFQRIFDAFLLDRRIAGLTSQTIETYRVHLRIFGRWCEAHDVSLPDLTKFLVRQFLAERQSRSQSRLVESYRRLRPFFRWTAAEGLCDDLFCSIRKPKEPTTLVPTLTIEQVRLMLALCRAQPRTANRNEALVRLLLDSGLRITEALKLRLDDVHLDDGNVRVRCGKGNKDRIAFIGMKTSRSIMRYLKARIAVGTDPIFDTRDGLPMKRRHAHQLIARLGANARISGVRVSPHTLRHTFATWFLRSGGDVFSLQRQLGHSSLSMTRRYLDLTQTDVAAAHGMHSPGNQL
jgi:integrase/recombinase XerD